MSMSGFQVTTTTSPISLPQVCCACATRPGNKSISIHGIAGRVRRTFTLPYCDECLRARRKVLGVRALLLVGLTVVSAAFAGLGAVLPMLPVVALIAAPVVVALALGIFGPRMSGTSLAVADAGRILSFAGASTTFLLVNEAWATRFAANNQVGVAKRGWSDGFVIRSTLLTTIVGAGVATWVGLSSNPPVHFDNATGKAVKIWLDGAPLLTIEPRTAADARPDLRLPYGTHKLGWSKASEAKPRDEEEVHVEWGKDHLYNPGEAGCYFLNATAYGSASTSGLERGPLPIRSFYVFKSVDNWFHGNPSSVSTKAAGETRVALLPWSSCMELTKRHCPLAVRKKAVECSKKSWSAGDDAGMATCMQRALASCDDE